MARVWYQFTEPSGRTIGTSPDPEPGSGSGSGSGSGPAGRSAAKPTDDLDLTRVINPITGASQPAFWLT